MRVKDQLAKMEHEHELWDITAACYTGVQVPDRHQFREAVIAGDVWIWVDEGNIVGYAIVQEDWNGFQNPVLRSIAVLPKYQGKGIGRCLLSEVEGFYRNRPYDKIVLHVKFDNPAQCLYFKAGYRVTRILKDYYAPEGDGLEMELKL